MAGINGWLPEKLQEEIIWNRTVNYSGGMGRNLPADLMNEILNRLFKGKFHVVVLTLHNSLHLVIEAGGQCRVNKY